MNYPIVAVPRPSQIVVKSRFAFPEEGILALQATLGGPAMRPGVTTAALAAHLAQCASDWIRNHEADDASPLPATIEWRDDLEWTLRRLAAMMKPIADNFAAARLALMVDEEPGRPADKTAPEGALAMLCQPELLAAAATIARQARLATKFDARRKEWPEHNASDCGRLVLLMALIDMLAWAFEGVERPSKRPNSGNRLFNAVHAAKEMIAAAIRKYPPHIQGREPDAYKRVVADLGVADDGNGKPKDQFSQEAMASLWRNYYEGWIDADEGPIDTLGKVAKRQKLNSVWPLMR